MSLIKAEINALRAELLAQIPLMVRAEVRKELERLGIGPDTRVRTDGVPTVATGTTTASTGGNTPAKQQRGTGTGRSA